jgi:hypothetical protein
MFKLEDLIGKNLYAKKTVGIKRFPMDSDEVIRTVQPGNQVGNVYSFLLPKPGRTRPYLMFYDVFNQAFYVEYLEANFDTKAFQDQGVLTLEQQQDQREEEAKGTWDKVQDFAVSAGLAIFGLIIVRDLIKK